MSDQLIEAVLPILRLARAGERLDAVPADEHSRRLLQYCRDRKLVDTKTVLGPEPQRPPMPPMPQRSKVRATDLRVGQYLVFNADDPRITAHRITQVYTGVYGCRTGVHVWAEGVEEQCWPNKARIDVLDGPLPIRPKAPPQESWKVLVLLPEGRVVLTEQELTADRTGTDGRTPNPAPRSKLSLDLQALAVFFEDRNRKIKDIARILGLKNTQSLAPKRCPELHKVMKACRAENAPPRGSKDRDGNIEAWGEDDE